MYHSGIIFDNIFLIFTVLTSDNETGKLFHRYEPSYLRKNGKITVSHCLRSKIFVSILL